MKSLVENKIILNGKEYIYVIQRKQIKNIYFRVKEDLKIYVSASSKVSDSYIRDLLNKNFESIDKMYNSATKKAEKNLRYLGYDLIFIYENCKPRIENNYIFGKSEEQCQDFIYKKALDVFESRLIQIKHFFDNLPDFRLRVRKMTTRWGVCNKKSMTVTLNTELITKDISLIDYVIIHELCHFKYMNHSREYWDYVKEFYPYYKEARKELKH